MVLHLIKKDILIAKKYVLFTLPVIAAIPLFILYYVSSLSSFMPFLYMVVLGELVLLQAISQEEAKFSKAVALLCAAPYPRNAIVQAKYILFLLVFAYCWMIHTLMMLLLNPSKLLDPTMVLTVLFLCVIVFSIYMPIEFKYGYTKAKFIFMFVIILLSLAPTILVEHFPNLTSGFSAWAAASSDIKNMVLAITSIAAFIISMLVSGKIFSEKDL